MATTVSVGPGSYMRPYRKPRIQHWPEAASQTFILGDLLAFSTDSYGVVKAGADPTADIVGVAAEAATGTTGNKVAVWLAGPENEFVAHIEDTGTIAATDIGAAFGVIEDTTNNIWRVDTTETGAPCVIVTQYIDGVGDTNGRVVFRFTNEVDTSNTQRRGPFTA